MGGSSLKSEYMSDMMKKERVENSDIVRVDQNQIIVKLEKGEGTLQIEKVGAVKKESIADEPVSVDIALVKTEPEDSVPRTPTPVRIPTPAEKTTDESASIEKEVSSLEEGVEPKEEPKDDVMAESEEADIASETVSHYPITKGGFY